MSAIKVGADDSKTSELEHITVSALENAWNDFIFINRYDDLLEVKGK